MFRGEESREELIRNTYVFVERVWRRGIKRGTLNECYCVCWRVWRME
jgi:hypothetical protein